VDILQLNVGIRKHSLYLRTIYETLLINFLN